MEAELTRIDYSIAVHQLGILKALAAYDPHIAGNPPSVPVRPPEPPGKTVDDQFADREAPPAGPPPQPPHPD